MLYECTDCMHCVEFLGDTSPKLVCLHSELTPAEVVIYYPLGDYNAADCPGFDAGDSQTLSAEALKAAEEYAADHTPEDDPDWWHNGVTLWIREIAKHQGFEAPEEVR